MIWLNRAGHDVCNHTIHQNLDVYPSLDPFSQRLHIDFQVLQWSVGLYGCRCYTWVQVIPTKTLK